MDYEIDPRIQKEFDRREDNIKWEDVILSDRQAQLMIKQMILKNIEHASVVQITFKDIMGMEYSVDIAIHLKNKKEKSFSRN